MTSKRITIGLLALALAGGITFIKIKKNKKMKHIEATVLPFYTQALTVNNETNPSEVLDKILSDDFISNGTVDNKNKAQLIGQLGFFWKMIPDLKWEPQEVIYKGNQVIVRSSVTGTPNSPEGKFFGVPTNGTKTFETASIDIHTIENGKIIKVHHIEDWATAIKQVSPK